MPRTFLLAALLALALAAGCKAQTAPLDAVATRRIELAIRSQYNLPQDVSVTLGERKPSEFPGYDALPVTLSKEERAQKLEFLLSRDAKTLSRLDSVDLSHDPMTAIDLKDRPVRGNPKAPVAIVSYDDLQCPYCAHMHQLLFPGILNRYKDLVRVVYKDDPLTEIHPWAMRAAVDSNCLAAQSNEAYWAYVDYIHNHLSEVSGPDRNAAKSHETLDRIARQQGALLKLEAPRLEACLAKQDESKVRAEMDEALKLGIEGTPALLIDGERIAGLVPEAHLQIAIDRALRARGIEPPKSPEPTAAKPATEPARKQ